MIDKRLYYETFSKLRASDEAKQEVWKKMQYRTKKRRPLRVLGLAAAIIAALCVTAGAVNAVTGGEFLRKFTIVWTGGDSYMAMDDAGNEVRITLVDSETVTKENGRLILRADGKEIDITDAIETDGAYQYTYEVTIVHEDGSEEIQTVTIDVTGNLEEWTVTEDYGDGIAYTTTHSDSEETAAEIEAHLEAEEAAEEKTAAVLDES